MIGRRSSGRRFGGFGRLSHHGRLGIGRFGLGGGNRRRFGFGRNRFRLGSLSFGRLGFRGSWLGLGIGRGRRGRFRSALFVFGLLQFVVLLCFDRFFRFLCVRGNGGRRIFGDRILIGGFVL